MSENTITVPFTGNAEITIPQWPGQPPTDPTEPPEPPTEPPSEVPEEPTRPDLNIDDLEPVDIPGGRIDFRGEDDLVLRNKLFRGNVRIIECDGFLFENCWVIAPGGDTWGCLTIDNCADGNIKNTMLDGNFYQGHKVGRGHCLYVTKDCPDLSVHVVEGWHAEEDAFQAGNNADGSIDLYDFYGHSCDENAADVKGALKVRFHGGWLKTLQQSIASGKTHEPAVIHNNATEVSFDQTTFEDNSKPGVQKAFVSLSSGKMRSTDCYHRIDRREKWYRDGNDHVGYDQLAANGEPWNFQNGWCKTDGGVWVQAA